MIFILLPFLEAIIRGVNPELDICTFTSPPTSISSLIAIV